MTAPDDGRTAGVVVRPPLLYLGALLAGLAADWLHPARAMPAGYRFTLGPALVVAALALAFWAFARFRRAGTNVPTNRPTLALVTDGPYRFSRNPIYLGLTALYRGLAVIAGSLWAVLLIFPVLAVMRWGVIAREERYLEARFGQPYRDYMARVRRWI